MDLNRKRESDSFLQKNIPDSKLESKRRKEKEYDCCSAYLSASFQSCILACLLLSCIPTCPSGCFPAYLSVFLWSQLLVYLLLSCIPVCFAVLLTCFFIPVLTIRSIIGLFDALPIWLSFCLLSSPTIDFSTSLRFCLFFICTYVLRCACQSFCLPIVCLFIFLSDYLSVILHACLYRDIIIQVGGKSKACSSQNYDHFK